MNKITILNYVLSVVLFLFYTFESYQFFIKNDIHAGIAGLIFLILLVNMRNLQK